MPKTKRRRPAQKRNRTVKPRAKRQGDNVTNPIANLLWSLSPRFLALIQQFSQPFKQHPHVFSAVTRIAENISGVPLIVKQGERGDGQIIESGDWVDLFDRINPQMDQQTFIEAISVLLSIDGMCVVVLESENNGRLRPGEIPFEMFPLSGRLFDPVIDPQTKRLIAWAFRPPEGGDPIIFELHEVVVVKFYNPDNPLRGLAPMDAVRLTSRSDWKAMLFDEAILDNGTETGGFLKLPQGVEWNDELYQQFKAQFEDRHQGPNKAGRFALLEQGMDWVPTGTSPKDMQYREKREWSRDEILSVFGVPKSEVGIEQPTNMVTGIGRLSTNAFFWQGTLLPIMEKIENAFWNQLTRRLTDGMISVEFDRTKIEALKPNFNAQLDQAIKLQQLGYTGNQINERLDLGMPETETGEISFIPAGMIPADALGDDEPLIFQDEEALKIDQPKTLQLTDGKSRLKALMRKRVEDRKSELGQIWERQFKTTMAPFEPKFRARFRRYLMALRSEQLRLLDQNFNVPDVPDRANRQGLIDAVLFDANKWATRIMSAHRGLYFRAALNSMIVADEDVDKTERVVGRRPELAKEVAEKRVRILVQANETIRRRLARQIEKGIKAGESQDKIATRVRKTFNQVSRKWSLVIARTEVSSTVNEARFRIYGDRGVQRHRWVTERDGKVRNTHLAQDGEVREVGARFTNGLRFPLDVGPPAEVVNCRCVTVPVPPEQ